MMDEALGVEPGDVIRGGVSIVRKPSLEAASQGHHILYTLPWGHREVKGQCSNFTKCHSERGQISLQTTVYCVQNNFPEKDKLSILVPNMSFIWRFH